MYYPPSIQEKINPLPPSGAALEGGSSPENKSMKTTIIILHKYILFLIAYINKYRCLA